jgi:hypothetical protein
MSRRGSGNSQDILAAVAVLLVGFVLVLLMGGWYLHHEASSQLCEKMGYGGFHLDLSGSYCYSWVGGNKVMTSLGKVGQ